MLHLHSDDVKMPEVSGTFTCGWFQGLFDTPSYTYLFQFVFSLGPKLSQVIIEVFKIP